MLIVLKKRLDKIIFNPPDKYTMEEWYTMLALFKKGFLNQKNKK